MTLSEKWRSFRHATANVQILDQYGSPVPNATISGQWSGGASDSDIFTTDSDGYGSCISDWGWKKADFTFCVTDVTKAGMLYDPESNIVSCGSSQ